jgi:hypothetical protein
MDQKLRQVEHARKADKETIVHLREQISVLKSDHEAETRALLEGVRSMVEQEVQHALATSSTSVSEATIASLRRHVETLDQDQATRVNVVAQDLERLNEALLGKHGAVNALKRANRELADKVEHGGVAYKKHSFASPDDFLTWVERQMPRGVPDYGLFVDVFSLLHTLSAGTITHSEALKTEHDQSKVNYKNSLQSRISTSYDTNFPDVFGRSDLSGQRFGASMDTHAKWYNPDTSQGLSVMIDMEMDRQYDAMIELVDVQLGGAPDLKYLAVDMLNDSKRFFAELHRFVEESYTAMKGGGGLDEKDAWDVTRSCFEQILTDVRASRGVVKYTRVDSPMLHVWGSLKAHEVMARYQKFKFKDDPALAGILIRFILKHQKDSSVVKLNSRLAKVESNCVSLKTEISRLKAGAGANS